MIIDVSQILKNDGSTLNINEKITLDNLCFNGQNIVFLSPLDMIGFIKNTGGNLVLSAKSNVSFETNCSRCLDKIEENLSFVIDEVFSQRINDVSSDFNEITSNEIDLRAIAEQNFCMNLPINYLCDEDCRGLCPTCGADLNRCTCDCEHDDLDPRLLVLKKFLKEDK